MNEPIYYLNNLTQYDTSQLTKNIFKDKGEYFPLFLYMDLLFNSRSPHAQLNTLSERIESLIQFLNGHRSALRERDSSVVGMIFSETLKYLKEKEYIGIEEYFKEYDACLEVWKNAYTTNVTQNPTN